MMRVCHRTGNTTKDSRTSRRVMFLYIASGVSALVWFLVRVLPKPSRAAYPCQRVAMPLASSFVLWIVGITGSLFAFRRAGRYFRRARYVIAALCVCAGLGIAGWSLRLPDTPALAAWTPVDAPNSPIGTAKGLYPGRVVWAHDPNATSWDGKSGYWWSETSTDQAVVDRMLARSLRRLTGNTEDGAAWDALFRHFNETRERGDFGYQAGEGIAIKINMNVSRSYAVDNDPIVSPHVVLSLLDQLVHRAGVAESAISVYDASRAINGAVFDPCHSAFPAVQFVDLNGVDGRKSAGPDTTVAVHYADARVSGSGTTRLPACVVKAGYVINLALLRGHTRAGVTLCAKNHFGSVWLPNRVGWWPSNLHGSIDQSGNDMGAPNVLVDLMGHAHLGGKTLLFMIDGLYAAEHQGSERPSRWTSTPFGGDWTSSLFVSQDGVAIDSVGLDICRYEPILDRIMMGTSVDNYLHEAALADDPPSGVEYDPEGDGTALTSVGVHEHWNNPADKQYSRNLGTGLGIELVMLSGEDEGDFLRGDANADGGVDLSDSVRILLYLFNQGREPNCLSSADVDDTGQLEITDAVYLLNFLFLAAEWPPSPSRACGPDPTEDDLGCESYGPCGS